MIANHHANDEDETYFSIFYYGITQQIIDTEFNKNN